MKNLFNKLSETKLDNKKIFLIALASLVIFYIDLSFIMKLQLQGIKGVTAKIVKAKKDINTLTEDLSRLQELERKAGGGTPQAIALKSKEVISEDSILLLLQEISDLANKNKIKITQINTSKDKKVQEEVIAGERYLPVIIRLNLSCGYHTLGSFMDALENARYFIELQDMKITRDPKNYLLEDVNLVLKTYAKK